VQKNNNSTSRNGLSGIRDFLEIDKRQGIAFERFILSIDTENVRLRRIRRGEEDFASPPFSSPLGKGGI